MDSRPKEEDEHPACTFHGYDALTVLFCSETILDPTVGHTVDVLSLFISVLCPFHLTSDNPHISTPNRIIHFHQSYTVLKGNSVIFDRRNVLST